MSGRRDCQRYI